MIKKIIKILAILLSLIFAVGISGYIYLFGFDLDILKMIIFKDAIISESNYKPDIDVQPDNQATDKESGETTIDKSGDSQTDTIGQDDSEQTGIKEDDVTETNTQQSDAKAESTANNQKDPATKPEDTSSSESAGETTTNNNAQPVPIKTEPVVVVEPTPEELKAGVVKKYTDQFEELRLKYEGKLNTLLGQAKAEYLSYPEEERSDHKVSLGLKYFKLGKGMEEECDVEFYAIIGKMKAELEENDYSTESIEVAEKAYKSQKKARQRAIIEKGL